MFLLCYLTNVFNIKISNKQLALKGILKKHDEVEKRRKSFQSFEYCVKKIAPLYCDFYTHILNSI